MTEAEILENVVVAGDLAQLKPETRVMYYREVCKSLGLNPLTRPFSYLVLNGKLTLYATRTATDQLRALKGISIDRIDQAEVGDLYTVTVYGHDSLGRVDSEVGVVSVANLKGENLANAIMKAVTKAKRRLTLALAGLGWLDDSEVGTVNAYQVEVDPETGEVTQPRPSLHEQIAARRDAVTTRGLDDEPEWQEVPADPAGVRTDTPDSEPGSTDADIPMPAPASGSEAPPFASEPMPGICGALPPEDDPLGLGAGGPCQLAGNHRVHRNSEGTWPKARK
jgi:hypothetical protein